MLNYSSLRRSLGILLNSRHSLCDLHNWHDGISHHVAAPGSASPGALAGVTGHRVLRSPLGPGLLSQPEDPSVPGAFSLPDPAAQAHPWDWSPLVPSPANRARAGRDSAQPWVQPAPAPPRSPTGRSLAADAAGGGGRVAAADS